LPDSVQGERVASLEVALSSVCVFALTQAEWYNAITTVERP